MDTNNSLLNKKGIKEEIKETLETFQNRMKMKTQDTQTYGTQ